MNLSCMTAGIIGVAALLLSANSCLAETPTSPPTFPPADCQIVQQDGLIAGIAKPQKLQVVLGDCGGKRNAWLVSHQGGRTILLDSLALPPPAAGESLDMAGGACLARKKPIMENIILHAHWGDRSAIRAGSGLIHVWLPDTRTRKFTELPLAGVSCQRDQP